MTTIHLAASVTHGVYQIDPADHPGAQLMEAPDFLGDLNLLADDDLIFTAVTEGDENHKAISAEYGIN